MKKKKAFFQKFLGKNLDVLIENKRHLATGNLKGITSNYIPVVAQGPDQLKNKIVTVTLEELYGQDLIRGKIREIDNFIG